MRPCENQILVSVSFQITGSQPSDQPINPFSSFVLDDLAMKSGTDPPSDRKSAPSIDGDQIRQGISCHVRDTVF